MLLSLPSTPSEFFIKQLFTHVVMSEHEFVISICTYRISCLVMKRNLKSKMRPQGNLLSSLIVTETRIQSNCLRLSYKV